MSIEAIVGQKLKQPTVIKQSLVVHCLMRSVTSTILLILFCNWLHSYNCSFYTWLCSPQACNNNNNNIHVPASKNAYKY